MKRTTIEPSVPVPNGAAATGRPPVARPAVEPVRTRRRPLLVGLGVALTALGGLGAVWLASAGTGTVTVVGVVKEVRAGDVIDKEDLVGVQVAAGSPLHTLSVDRYAEVVGKRSLVRLLPGSLLNPDAVADRLVPGAGQALVGLSLAPAQRPAVQFNAGDAVEILYAPANQDSGASSSSSSPPAPVRATVVSSQDDPDANRLVVNVTVPAASAQKVATWGSAGKATIVLLPAGQD